MKNLKLFLNEVRREKDNSNTDLKMLSNLRGVIEGFQVEINDSIKDIAKQFKNRSDIMKIIKELDKVNSPLANIRGKISQLK